MSPTNGRLPLPGLTPDQRQLVLDHEGLAHYHANHFRSGIEQLDKDQIARYALCRAAQGFTGKPEDFHRYASSWIINQLRREHQLRNNLRLGDQVAYDPDLPYSEPWLLRRSERADSERVMQRVVAFREWRVVTRSA